MPMTPGIHGLPNTTPLRSQFARHAQISSAATPMQPKSTAPKNAPKTAR